jgi:hypothetical protein
MGLQEEIRKLVHSESAKHKRLVEYVIRQLRAGRNLAEALDDPYVTNRLTPIERRALLDEPEVVEAASDDVLARMRAQLEALAGG